MVRVILNHRVVCGFMKDLSKRFHHEVPKSFNFLSSGILFSK